MGLKSIEFLLLEDNWVEMHGFVHLCSFPEKGTLVDLFFDTGDKTVMKRVKNTEGVTKAWFISKEPLL